MDRPSDFAASAAHIRERLDALYALETNRFLRTVSEAATVDEWYGAVLALNYAANSKELRDTGDARVHAICEEIRDEVKRINMLFRARISPVTPSQKQSWESAVSRDPSARYAFRDDGSLEISLLDARLEAATLHVKRLWNHVCNTEGDWVDFHIKLDETQVNTIRRKLSTLRAIRSTMKP